MEFRKITTLLIILFVLAPLSNLKAGKVEEIKIDKVSGKAVLTNSIEEARALALKNAKINALKKAGISENISVFTDYYQSENNEDYEELFSSNAMSRMNGAVKDVQIIREEKQLNENNEFQITITMSCTVIKHNTEPDPAFDFRISGIKEHYFQGTGLEFTVEPTANAFLTVFVFSNEEAYLLYPNEYEDGKKLSGGEKACFPVGGIKYTNTLDGDMVNNRLVFVLTKKEIKYIDEVNYNNVIDWINSIPLDERCVKSQSYLITRKNNKHE